MFRRLISLVVLVVACTALVRSASGQPQQPPPQQTPPKPDPSLPGEKRTAPPEKPAPPATPPQGAQKPKAQGTGAAVPNPNAYASTYQPLPSRPTIMRNATILTAAGPAIDGGSILLQNGRVAAVGANVTAPADALVIDAKGKWVTPGIIDTHSHLGAGPGNTGVSDGNEMTSPNTAEVSAEHSLWPQDPQFELALAGGVTTMHLLPHRM